MKNIIKFAGVVAVAVAMTQTIQAVPVVGNIGFVGGATLNTSSAGTATQVTSWIAPKVNLDSGVFAAPSPFAIAVGSAATFNASAWNFNTVVGLNPFWQVGGFSFQLLSSTIQSQGGSTDQDGFVFVRGTGIITGNGFDATVMSWSFTTQDPKSSVNPDAWTFSASANSTVPDGGSTVMLLGIALSGAAMLRRKLTA